MRRLRLASLALAGSFLLTMSGCCSFCEDGRLFPRLFNRSSSRPAMMEGSFVGAGVGCECNHGPSAWTPGMPVPVGQGPFMPPPPVPVTSGPQIPITNIQPPPQPQLVPQAPPRPYFPGS